MNVLSRVGYLGPAGTFADVDTGRNESYFTRTHLVACALLLIILFRQAHMSAVNLNGYFSPREDADNVVIQMYEFN